MKKIRINELARELEVKPGLILDLLPDLGVSEKKTHSSSIDEETAIALKDRLAETGSLGSHPHGSNGNHADDGDANDHSEVHGSDRETARPVERPEESESKGGVPQNVPVAENEIRPAAPRVASPAPSAPATAQSSSARPPSAPLRPSIPLPVSKAAPAPVATSSAVAGEVRDATRTGSASETTDPSPAMPAVPERPVSRFQPLRPPVRTSGKAIQPPLAPPSTGMPVVPPSGPSRNVAIPARRLPEAPPREGSAQGPRQPLPSTPGIAPTFRPQPPLATTPPARSAASAVGGDVATRGMPGAPSSPAIPAAPIPGAPPTPSSSSSGARLLRLVLQPLSRLDFRSGPLRLRTSLRLAGRPARHLRKDYRAAYLVLPFRHALLLRVPAHVRD